MRIVGCSLSVGWAAMSANILYETRGLKLRYICIQIIFREWGVSAPSPPKKSKQENGEIVLSYWVDCYHECSMVSVCFLVGVRTVISRIFFNSIYVLLYLPPPFQNFGKLRG